MRYLVDTNILIDHLRGDAKAGLFLEEIEKEKLSAFISVITEYEVLCGKFSKKEGIEIKRLLSIFPSISVTSQIAGKAADFYKKYRTNIADALIASTCYYLDCVLVTCNLKHFQKIKEISVKSI